MRKLLIFGLLCVIGFSTYAQIYTRPDDYFWTRKVVNRIDLSEKINKPLIAIESKYYTDQSQYTEKRGVVGALFDGLKKGKYVAYHPDSLNVALSYDQVLQRVQRFETGLTGGGGFDEDEEEGGFDDFSGDDFAADGEDDEWGFDDEFGGSADDLGGSASSGYVGDFDLTPYETVIQFVENRIFDKNRSDMVYDIEYIEIIWTDPGEALPDKPLCTFRYKDAIPVLEKTQWKNRFNDAEYRTMREIFELRLFHSFIIDVSGVGVRTLEEAEQRRQQMVEFEHYLWSY